MIILGVVILVLLIIGFTFGWNTLLPWLKSDNVETIVQQCSAACVTGSKYDFCSKERTLKDGEKEIETNCATFAVISEYGKYGIESCSSISCDLECTEISAGTPPREGELLTEGELMEGFCPETYEDVTSISKVEVGTRCCVPGLTE